MGKNVNSFEEFDKITENISSEEIINEAKKKDTFTSDDMEQCWSAARRKRFDTGISMHNSFEDWFKKYKK